jgi:membrane protease YdiL (CAAX protease family)
MHDRKTADMQQGKPKLQALHRKNARTNADAAGQALVCVLLYAVARQALQAMRQMAERQAALHGVQGAALEALRWGDLLAITVLAAVPALVWIWRRAGLNAYALGLHRPQKSVWWLPVLYILLLCGVVSPLARRCGVQLGAGTQLPEGRIALVLAFLQLCVASPLIEELLFRGAVQQLLRSWGTACAVLVQAALFASLHGGVAQIMYALVMGLLLGWAAQYSGSLLPSILLHGVNNGILFAELLATGGI